jgi:hypothetical protein
VEYDYYIFYREFWFYRADVNFHFIYPHQISIRKKFGKLALFNIMVGEKLEKLTKDNFRIGQKLEKLTSHIIRIGQFPGKLTYPKTFFNLIFFNFRLKSAI